MKMPEYVQQVIDKQELHILSTASKEGHPNIIYLKFLKVYDEEHILIADNKFYKTEANLTENPRLAFVVLDEENHAAYQLKGSVEFHTSGQVFEETRRWVLDEQPHPDIYPKSAVLLHVERIYRGTEQIREQ